MMRLHKMLAVLLLCAVVLTLSGCTGGGSGSGLFSSNDCPACGGSGYCANCGGDRRCNACRDTGLAPNTTCQMCHGSRECYSHNCTNGRAYDALNNRYYDCTLCDGRNVCARCDGTGLDSCPTCHGGSCDVCRGVKPSGACPYCEGTGERR